MTKAIPYVPYVGPVVTRTQAKSTKAPRYFTGKLCKHGHIAERVTASGTCIVCARAITKKHIRLNPPNPILANEARRRWAQKNPEKARIYYKANSERIKARVAALKRANPAKVNAQARNRKARKAGLDGFHTSDEIRGLLQRQNGRCIYCSRSIARKFHADHIVPTSSGGSNWISNIQLTCPTCNMRKSRLDPIVFAARLGRLL